MNHLQLLQKINPHFSELITQNISDEHGEVVGVKCFGIEKNNDVFSGGTALQKETAIRIAVAEAFERSYLEVIYKDPKKRLIFDLDNFPSSSGFAAGFDDSSTRFRAICEGLERWVWSKWIDEQFVLPRVNTSDISLTPLAKHLLKSFDDLYWFEKEFQVRITPLEIIDLKIAIFLGCNGNGIYPGSRVSTQKDDLYQHPVIEAHRNYWNAIQNKLTPLECNDIIHKRGIFFAENKNIALLQVNSASKENWPSPELHLLEKYKETGSDNIFLYRCLFKDFIGWHLGNIERFVY